jgi:selenocysteine lyase/cysteine desulfurase
VRKELIEEFEPPFIGWASVKPEVFETIDFWEIKELQLSESASRFEVGSPSFISFVGADAAIKLLLDMNIDTIHKRVLSLTDMLIDSLKNSGFNLTTPEDTKHRSGIIHFTTDKAEDKAKRLARKQIIISARSHGLRVAPHFYNSEEEIDHFIRELTSL